MADDDASIVYFNGDMININTVDTGAPDPVIRFTQARMGSTILDNPGDYYLSIIKWQMDCGANLPLFIPVIQPNQTVFNPNLTIYSVCMTAVFGGNNLNYVQPLIYENKTGLSPPSGSTIDHANEYYWMHTYTSFCSMVNTAISTIYNQIVTDYGARDTACPLLVYNDSTNKFSIYCDSYGYGEDPDRRSKGEDPDEKWELYFNSNLALLLKNFEYEYNPNGENASMTYRLMVRNKVYNITDNPFHADTIYYVMTQEWESTDSFSPISGIVFSTGQMETVTEYSGSLVVLTGNNNVSIVPQNVTETVITDVSLELVGGAHDYKQMMTYSPAGEYRLTDFLGRSRSLKTIDFYVSWKCKYDANTYPVRMPSLGHGNIKIMFRKK